jgi:hypothetical protein
MISARYGSVASSRQSNNILSGDVRAIFYAYNSEISFCEMNRARTQHVILISLQPVTLL